MKSQIRIIETVKIEPNGRSMYDSDGIDEMIRSIRQMGQLEPIKIWFTGSCFRILDGEKRWRAFKKMGLCEIKAIVVEDIDE